MTTISDNPPCLPAQKRGDTWRLVFRWLQSNGQPVDLTGCAARLQVRHATSKKLAATPDSLVVDLEAGTVTAVFLPTTIELVNPGQHYLTDMELVYADGSVQSSDTIQLPVAEDVTRPVVV